MNKREGALENIYCVIWQVCLKPLYRLQRLNNYYTLQSNKKLEYGVTVTVMRNF